LTSGEEFESGPDEGRSVTVEFDSCDVASIDLLADVEVTELRFARRPAAGGLRGHLEGHIRTELAGVVLVDPIEDERDQIALRTGL
jgi:hypothetical protein